MGTYEGYICGSSSVNIHHTGTAFSSRAPDFWWSPYCSSFKFSVLCCAFVFVCLRHVACVTNSASVSKLYIPDCPFQYNHSNQIRHLQQIAETSLFVIWLYSLFDSSQNVSHIYQQLVRSKRISTCSIISFIWILVKFWYSI